MTTTRPNEQDEADDFFLSTIPIIEEEDDEQDEEEGQQQEPIQQQHQQRPMLAPRAVPFSPFDPLATPATTDFSPTAAASSVHTAPTVQQRSLLDDPASSVGFLEMEPEEAADATSIRTTSGLLLTHRRPISRHMPVQQQQQQQEPHYTSKVHYNTATSHSVPLFLQQRRLLTWARTLCLTATVVTVLSLTVLIRSRQSVHKSKNNHNNVMVELVPVSAQTPSIVLLPLYSSQQQQQGHHRRLSLLDGMRNEFQTWKERHGKLYDSDEEHEKRFQIWLDNTERTRQKNDRHGPCQFTGRSQVFSSDNHLQDLTTEEFRSQYLTGYTGPKADVDYNRPPVLGEVPATRHRALQRKMRKLTSTGAFGTDDCAWYDLACILAFYFDTYFYGLGRTMEPAYDADSYPSAIDWRDLGAVGSVRKQGDCGACWAVTAVETIESALFIGGGELLELSESEVIICASDCEMCEGGWPQEAIEYVMGVGGVPLLDDLPYDGSFLLQMTYASNGEETDDALDEDTYNNYMNMCPAGSGSGSGSGDNNSGGGYSYSRYGGDIRGYGYATEKCVCYTDGTGCDCDSQNEGMAVRNVATYGPAVVCFDASTWQDYSGGVITSNSGCSSSFMDVNHCAQVVGYAFTSGDDDAQEEWSGSGSNSGSGSGSGSGSQDNSDRTGYWIVRNQWSEYWGMNGYAYVAMGDNTCGVLNDMIIAYT